MRSVEERLRSTDEGFPAHAVDPTGSVAEVVRRGRIRLALARIGTGLLTAAVVAAGVVAVPQLITPPGPEVVSPVIEPAHENSKEKEEPATGKAPGDPVDLAFIPDRRVADETVEEPKKETDDPVSAEPVEEPVKEPAPEEPDPAPAPGFTANQELESVEHDPPYNKYHGTAAPGTKVRAGNDYGSASAVADGKGNWYVKVWFEGAPYGTHTLTVVVESSDGHRQTFEMTATRPEKKQTFSANQKYASSDAEPPTNLYWGTAQPNSQVDVISEYGSAQTMANADGHWETWVTFEGAPAGTATFVVKARSLATGEHVKFEMTTHRAGSSEQVAFSAYQKWSTIEGDPPSNVYWGTAQPNSQVDVMSEYGSVETMSDENGNWETTLVFEKAPAGTTTFTVKVRSLASGEYLFFEVTTIRPA